MKEDIRKAFNKVMRKKALRDVSDSKSSLTTKPIYFKDEPNIMFSIDVGLVTKDDEGKWHRLKHKKTGNTYYDEYYWNEAPNSKKYDNKAKEISKL